MPTPGKDETQEDFISRCIPIVLEEGTAEDNKQAAAVCYSMWREAKEKKEAHVYEAAITPRTTEAADFQGREWDVTIIGSSGPDNLVTANGHTYLRSKNGRLYNIRAIAESAAAWDGVKVYDNHLTDEEFKERAGMRSVAREWIGSIVKPRWDAQRQQLRGVLKIVEEGVARKLKNAWDAGVLKTVGLSIDTLTVAGDGLVVEGRTYPTIEGFQKVLSVDLVAEPAAGGGFNRLIAAQTQQEAQTMDEKEVRELISETLKSTLPDVVSEALAAQRQEEAEEKPPEEEVSGEQDTAEEEHEPEAEQQDPLAERVRQLESAVALERHLAAAHLQPETEKLVRELLDGKRVSDAQITNAVKRAKEADAARDGSGRVNGAGSGNVQTVISARDKAEVELLRLVMGNTEFRALEGRKEDWVQDRVTESYKAWVRDGRPHNYGHVALSEWLRHWHGDPFANLPARSAEALTTSDISSIVKNAVNVMLANDYAKRQRWWDPIVRYEEVDTIDQATLVRTYGLDTLDVVNEGAAYTESDWEDEEETASFVKRGNYVGITLESLLRDKVSAIRTLPMRLSTAWYNTISTLVSGVFTVNSNTGPVLGTTGALFNASAVSGAGGHANLLTTALSFAQFGVIRTAMMKQTDQPLGAGQRLLIEPRYLVVPVDLETTALQIRNSVNEPGTADNDLNPYYQRFDVVVNPHMTDTNDYACVGDPQQFPAIWLIFLRGRRVPELFTAGDETSGAMFTNDTLRYKVRMLTYRFSSTYDCAPVSDFRPLHKSNV